MFHQEKHPGEKLPHLFQTNKHDLLVINLLFRSLIESPVASLITSPAWVPQSPNKGAVAAQKHRAVPSPPAGNKDTHGQGV